MHRSDRDLSAPPSLPTRTQEINITHALRPPEVWSEQPSWRGLGLSQNWKTMQAPRTRTHVNKRVVKSMTIIKKLHCDPCGPNAPSNLDRTTASRKCATAPEATVNMHPTSTSRRPHYLCRIIAINSQRLQTDSAPTRHNESRLTKYTQ